jgi:hypothetical protein
MSATRTASGFEVRELHHGSSNVAFDYRVVALRRGSENVRLEDVTERWSKLNTPLPKGTPQQRPERARPSLATASLNPGTVPSRLSGQR